MGVYKKNTEYRSCYSWITDGVWKPHKETTFCLSKTGTG